MFAQSFFKYTSSILWQQPTLRTFSKITCPKKQLLPKLPLHSGQFKICRFKHSDSSNNLSSSSHHVGGLRLIWRNIFGKYLLVTNIVGSGVLMVVGDVMAQEIELRRGIPDTKRYDWARIGRMFIVGALQGPMHHYVYNWMDKIMPVANLRNVIWKILIDQLFMSPACILIFYYTACYLEKKTIRETNDELKEKFLFIYCMDWLLWPGAQYINFRYLDTKYRVTFVNICTALYNVFMSYVKHDYNIEI